MATTLSRVQSDRSRFYHLRQKSQDRRKIKGRCVSRLILRDQGMAVGHRLLQLALCHERLRCGVWEQTVQRQRGGHIRDWPILGEPSTKVRACKAVIICAYICREELPTGDSTYMRSIHSRRIQSQRLALVGRSSRPIHSGGCYFGFRFLPHQYRLP